MWWKLQHEGTPRACPRMSNPRTPPHLPLRGVKLCKRVLHLGIPVGIVTRTVSSGWHSRVQLNGHTCA